MEKECRACHVTKPASEFYGNNQKKDGLSSYCKECFKAKIKARYVAHPRPRPPEGMKTCKRCQETKPVAEFGSHKGRADGLQYNCRKCDVITQTEWRRKHPEYHRANSKKWREKNEQNRQRHYENSVRHRIGDHVAHGTYAKLLAEQEGKCAICGATAPGPVRVKRFHIDHCHTSNQVRGLLCHNCNHLLGHALDSPTILEAARAYLLKHHPEKGGGS